MRNFATQLDKDLQEQSNPSPYFPVASVQKDIVPILTCSSCSERGHVTSNSYRRRLDLQSKSSNSFIVHTKKSSASVDLPQSFRRIPTSTLTSDRPSSTRAPPSQKPLKHSKWCLVYNHCGHST